MCITVQNFLNKDEQQELELLIKHGKWDLSNYSFTKDVDRVFWSMPLFNQPCINIFQKKIENGINQKIKINRIRANGQAHGQCGSWHVDNNQPRSFTLVYFPYEWPPEYGGHLLIKSEEIISILPEFNKAVIFNSNLHHVGLEPTVHCKTQRVSVACVFKVL